MDEEDLNVGDSYTKTECVDGKKVIVTYEVTQVIPDFESKVISKKETDESC